MLAEFIVRRFPALKTLSEATTGLRSTGFLSLAVAQVEAERQERARAGRLFSGIGIAAGAAPIQAIPTTTATHALYNPDGRSYVIESVGAYLLSGVATVGATLFGIVTRPTSTVPVAATGSLVASGSNGGLASKAIVASAYTIPTPSGNSQWFAIPLTSQPGAIPGVGGYFAADVRGGIVVPPYQVLGLCVMAGAGTAPLYVPTFTWTEAEIDLE